MDTEILTIKEEFFAQAGATLIKFGKHKEALKMFVFLKDVREILYGKLDQSVADCLETMAKINLDYLKDVDTAIGNFQGYDNFTYSISDGTTDSNVARVDLVVGDDRDGDNLPALYDNCPLDHNPDQFDLDGDQIGDVCDDDRDGDGLLNVDDWCPDAAGGNTDMDGDDIGDDCDDDKDGDGISNVLETSLGVHDVCYSC